MSLTDAIKRALRLLTRRDRRTLLLVIGAQAVIAVMDLVGVLLLGLVVALATSAVTKSSMPIGGAITKVMGLPPSPSALQVAALAAISGSLLILKSLIGLYLTRRTFRFLANRQADLSGQLAEQLLSRPLLDVQARSSQESSYALTNGMSAVTMGLVGQSVVVVSELLVLVALIGGLFFVDRTVTTFTIVFFALVAYVLQRLLGTWAQRLGLEQSTLDVDSVASIQHAIRAYREVTILGRRRLFIDRFRDLRRRAAHVIADTFVLYQISKYVYEIALVVGAAVLVIGAATTHDLVSAITVVAIFLAASTRIFPSLLRMQSALVNMRNSIGQAQPTFALIDALEIPVSQTGALDIESKGLATFYEGVRQGHLGFVGNVTVRHASLTYPLASRPALRDVSLEVPPGTSTAIVGATGSGKSTLVDVILGVLDIDSGEVLVADATPGLAVGRWPGAIAYVPQDVAVLSGTVRENVALGLPTEAIDDGLVSEALERAHLADFLRDSREGLETVVGENGVRLSGGQRQRLGIARALYSRPRLIVLDEATSALDAETESLVTNTLESLAGEVTLIVVAHRLATVRKCNQVLYLDEGRIVASGSFDHVRRVVADFDRQAELLGL